MTIRPQSEALMNSDNISFAYHQLAFHQQTFRLHTKTSLLVEYYINLYSPTSSSKEKKTYKHINTAKKSNKKKQKKNSEQV